MDSIQSFYEYALLKKGVSEHFPFDQNILVFKVGGKIFALTALSDWEQGTAAINLKCDPERAVELREEYEEINPGYHMNKKHWNTLSCTGRLPAALIRELIDHSYELVLASLPKKLREEIGQMN
ncbi:MmcQ/YjbR family DNA-binding protein [Flavobacterium sp. JP2137]|uniref:MmcQ/YjbR family DNA-binding protein n=1 Tax=Flavobacterium sp. JP2137 TaxID=3414510 RepID=UPI003D30040B